MTRIDLHTHSAVSDGTDPVAQLVEKAAQLGLTTLALTDHDTFAGLDEAFAAGIEYGVQVVGGFEFSTQLGGVSVHLLGYGMDVNSVSLNAELSKNRAGRKDRIPAMLAKLAQLGMPIDSQILAEQVGDSPSVGRPHIADAMIKQGYIESRREAFEKYLSASGPAYVSRYSTPLTKAIDLIHQSAGVAVIAHPWSRETKPALDEQTLAWLVQEYQLDGIEVDHQDHDAQTRSELGKIAGRLGLLATGSSDYHGLGKTNHDLGCNTTAVEVFDELMARIADKH